MAYLLPELCYVSNLEVYVYTYEFYKLDNSAVSVVKRTIASVINIGRQSVPVAKELVSRTTILDTLGKNNFFIGKCNGFFCT